MSQTELFPQEPQREIDFSAAIRRKKAAEASPSPAPAAKDTITAIVLSELSLGAGSDRQVAARLECKGFTRVSESVRKRRRELEDSGYVRFAGRKVINDLGNAENVYEITHAGRLRAGVAA